MKVKNINGTTDNTCKCDSWLNHWEIFSGKSVPIFCSIKICTKSPEVGAHIQKANSSDDNWYIVPLCQSHNSIGKDKVLDISDSIKLVSANVSETCGK